jgi:spore cortex biosynthesis protein YabQ
VTLAVQGWIFAVMLLLGVWVGMWADLLRFITRKCRKLLIAILDLFFWATVICLVFVVLINLNYLELRLYAFASLGIGCFLYFRFLSSNILKFYDWAFGTAVKVIKWLGRIFRPLLLPLRLAAILLDGVNLLFLSIAAIIAMKCKDFTSPGQDIPPAA